jgi:predicted dehydrogenase
MKILMIGLGAIGQRHLRNLRKLKGDDLEILAYRFRNTSRVLTDDLKEEGGNLEDKYNIESYDDLDLALAQKPDAVFVCNPSSLHIPTAIKAARAGCHLFIEKPLSNNLDQIEELIDLVDGQKLIAVVGYQLRFNPCLQRLHAVLNERMIGHVLSVRVEVGEYLPGWHTYEDYRNSYASRKELGGGSLLSQIHEMDYLYWLFGLPRKVFALGGHLSGLEIDVEDVVEVLMECEFDNRPVPVSVHLDYLQRPSRRVCEVIGDQGKILVDFAALTVDVFKDEGKQVVSSSFVGFERNKMFLEELDHFLARLQGNPGPLVSLQEATQSLRMALAAKDSLATGKVVYLER